MKVSYLLIGIALLSACAPSSPCRGDVAIDGEKLTATSRNVTVTFRGGDLVGIKNNITGERYSMYSGARLQPMLDMNLLKPTGIPMRCTMWRAGRETDTGINSAQTTFTDLTRSVWMNVVIDMETQDIVVTLWGESKRDGVTGLNWAIRGLDLSNGKLIVPAQGGICADKQGAPLSQTFSYPTEWEAQMAIWQGAAGGFVLYSRDEEARFKKLHLSRRDSYADVGLETEAVAPWSKSSGVPQMEWRINTYRGDWKVPAAGFRNLMHFNRKPVEAVGPRAWVREIRAVVNLRGPSPDPALLDSLAARLTPARTLIYLPDWRKQPVGANSSEYDPSEGVRTFIERAHALGFRVMLHTDMTALSSRSPEFARLARCEVRDAQTEEPVGQGAAHPADAADRVAIMDPAAGAYRTLFVSRMRPVVEELHPDALHLGGSGIMYNNAAGTYEDKNYPLGSVALHRALLTAFPELVLGGEGVNELTAPYEWFAQRWIGGSLPTHPISTFLFGDHVQFYGHRAEPGPDAAPAAFLRYISRYEGWGVIPTLSVSSARDIAPGRSGMDRMMAVARAWQDNLLEPDWAADWSGAVFRWFGTKGISAAVESVGPSTLLRLDKQILYQRVRGANQLVTSRHIPGWRAYDDNALLGLDPVREYWLDPLPRVATDMRLTAVPAGLVVTEAHVTEDAGLFRFGAAERPGLDLIKSLPQARAGTTYAGRDGALGDGATAELRDITIGSDTREALVETPPTSGRADGEAFVEFDLLPKGNRPALAFSIGLADNAAKSTGVPAQQFDRPPPRPAADSAAKAEGVTYRITVDGKEVWRERVEAHQWLPRRIDLASYIDRDVKVRLITSSQPPKDGSRDRPAWSEIRMASDSEVKSGPVTVALPPGSQLSDVAGTGTASASSAGPLSIPDVHPGAAIAIFLKPGAAVSSGQSVLDLPFHSDIETGGQTFEAEHGKVGTAVSGGISKDRAIESRLPIAGRTLLTWVLKLPDTSMPVLGFSAGLADGAKGAAAFTVRVNGEDLWSAEIRENRWNDASVNLAKWRGRTVLVQLITENRGDALDPGARWADVFVR